MFASRVVQKRFTNLRTVAALSIPLAILFMFMMPTSAFAAIDASSLVSLTNQDRAAQGLGQLTVNSDLVRAAQAKANDMAAKSYFSHTTPEGYSSWHWFKQVGYSYSRAGENLAQGYSTSSQVETAWLNSPTHRANLMNPGFTEIGIATAVGTYQGRQVVFVAQMFGTPKNAAVAKTAPAPVKAVAQTAPATKPVTQAATAPVAKPKTVAATKPAPVEAPKVAVTPKAEPAQLVVHTEPEVVVQPEPVVVASNSANQDLSKRLELLQQLLLLLSYSKLGAFTEPYA